MIGRGSLILVMGFGMILGYIAWNLNEYATRAVGNMSTYHYSTQSHNLAVAGASRSEQPSHLRSPVVIVQIAADVAS